MKQKIIKILNDIRPEFDFSGSVNFIEQGMLDSFDIVSLVVALDNEFKISIDGMDILPENFSSVDRIAGLLLKKGVQE
jgi:acyl carrier protein